MFHVISLNVVRTCAEEKINAKCHLVSGWTLPKNAGAKIDGLHTSTVAHW